MEDSIVFCAVVFAFYCAIMGYRVYCKNIVMQVDHKYTILPWGLFAAQSSASSFNIFLSDERNLVEILTGVVLLIGPSYIVYRIIKGIMEVKKASLSSEFSSKSIELWLIVGCMSIAVLLIYFEQTGDNKIIELRLAISTIILDIIAVIGLCIEIKDEPEVFEIRSWGYWGVATFLIFVTNGVSYENWSSIGSIMIIEDGLISLLIISWITTFQHKRKKAMWKKEQGCSFSFYILFL